MLPPDSKLLSDVARAFRMVIAGKSGIQTLLYAVATGAINVSYMDASMKRLDLAPSFWTNDINFPLNNRETVLDAGRAYIEGKQRDLIAPADDVEAYLLNYLREECRRGRITENAANNRASRAHMALPFPPQDKRDEPKKALTIDPQFLAARLALKQQRWGRPRWRDEPKEAATIEVRPYPGLSASIEEIERDIGKVGQEAIWKEHDARWPDREKYKSVRDEVRRRNPNRRAGRPKKSPE